MENMVNTLYYLILIKSTKIILFSIYVYGQTSSGIFEFAELHNRISYLLISQIVGRDYDKPETVSRYRTIFIEVDIICENILKLVKR